MRPKIIFLIADGMGDRPCPELNNQTPLEAAHTPNMDKLASKGVMGTCQTIPEGMPPGSDVANMALLGYDPAKYHTGRGPIEAASQEIKAGNDDLIWRLNLVNLSEFSDNGIMYDYSAGHIPTSKSAPIIKSLQSKFGDNEFTFVPGIQYRHLLIQKNGAHSDAAGLNISPPHDITDQPFKDDYRQYSQAKNLMKLIEKSARELEKQSQDCKARSIWPWGQGKPLLLPSFSKLFELNGAVISAVDLVMGLGKAAKMQVLTVEGATGFLDTNYQGKVEAALKFITAGDFVYLHVEAPDECGHTGSAAKKIQAIEDFDAKIMAPLLDKLGDSVTWLLTCDHFTPIEIRTHSTEPVPFVLAGKGIVGPKNRADIEFSEKNAARSDLKIASGEELIPFVLKTLRSCS